MPKLSIVIPTLKEEAYIKETIEQFKKLPISHEIIVSDGGSADATVAIARPLADTVLVNDDGKPSPAKQRNAGARIARGEILVFIDSSVVVPEPEAFFSYVSARFDNSPELVALCGPQRIRADIETPADRFFLWFQQQVIWFQNNVRHHGWGTGKCMLMRRSAFEAVGGFHEQLIAGEDLDLMRRLSRIGTTRFDARLAIRYSGRREHALGWSHLLWVWLTNVAWMILFHRSIVDEWTPVR